MLLRAYLVSDIRPGIADVTVHLAHDANVLIAVQERVFLISWASLPATAVDGFVRFETGIGEDNDHPLGARVGGRNWNMLLGDESW
jgi:hypothetical protein